MMRKNLKSIFKFVIAPTILGAIVLWPRSGINQGCVGKISEPMLRMQLPYEPVNLDFSLAEDGVSLRVLSALMTGLVSYDRDYHIKMEIAERMDILDGGARYRFKLKSWKWSDGKLVTAQEFVYGMRRTLDPETPSKLADLLFFIKGARAFKKGDLKDFSKVGVVAQSDDFLEITLETPVSFFPHVLTLPVGFPQREDQITSLGPQWFERMTTTGPYKMSRWLHDQRIEIDQNLNYPNFEKGAPTRAVFQIIPEEATAVNLFENHKIDVLFKVPSFDLDRMRKRNLVREFPYFATYYVAFNQKQPPWDDPKARLAVAQAINRKQIVEAIGGTEQLAESWIPKGLPGYNNSIGVKYNPEAARENWRKSKGWGQKNLKFGFDTSFRNQTVVERIQADLRATLDVNIEMNNRDWKTYLRELSTKSMPMYRFGWLSPFVDAYGNLVVFASDNSNNYTGWRNSQYDRLLNQIALMNGASAERQKLIDKAQKILVEDSVTVIPIFHYVQTLIVSQKVESFWVNGMGMVDFMKIRIRD